MFQKKLVAMSKDKEIFGLHKIPDKELIKQLRVEIGILYSEIDELKYKLEEKSPLEHKQSENSEYIRSMEGQVKNLKLKIKQLEDDFDITTMKEQISSLNELISTKNRKIIALERELLKQLKYEKTI